MLEPSFDLMRTMTSVLVIASMLSCARATPPEEPVPVRPEVPVTDRPTEDTGRLAIPPLPLPAPVRPQAEPGERGLVIRLREAPSGTVADTAPPAPDPAGPFAPAAAETLSVERTERLLARLPALPAPDTASFRFPAASPPPPRTGRVVLEPFPPPDSMAPPAPAPHRSALEVIRAIPTGETLLAPHLTITFSDAMVPLTTVAGTETRSPPARLTPEPPGRWLWIDTRTLRFEPDTRFPMATSFTVEIPSGTRSAAGESLAESMRAVFSTTPPRAIGAYPALPPAGEPDDRMRRVMGTADHSANAVPLQPVVLIAFDQRVDPDAIAQSARLLAGGRPHAIRVATAAEVAADSVVRALVQNIEEGRWAALRPVQPLPGDADIRVVLAAGTPSAEGPRTTVVSQELRFRTYGPMRIASHRCWVELCRPAQPLRVLLTNPIDERAWTQDLVSVEPAIEDMSVQVLGSEVRIGGDTRPSTRYSVTLSQRVRDRFGQPLEGERTVMFDVGPPAPFVTLPGGPIIVLDPDGPPRQVVQSQGHALLRVRVYRVAPEDWPAYGRAVAESQRMPAEPFEPPGELVASTAVEVGNDSAGFNETLVDVGPALRDGFGHAIVTVEPEGSAAPRPERDPRQDRSRVHAWVQSTRIGLAASIDGEELRAWTSSLDAGEPLGGVTVTLLPTDRSAVTSPDGTARLPLTSGGDEALIATRGSDAALLPASIYTWNRRIWLLRPMNELRWFTLTDRGLYQPGESVHLKGWLRHRPGDDGAWLRMAGEVDSIRFTVRGPRREELGTGIMEHGRLGGFSTTIELPAALNLGSAGIELQAIGDNVPEQGERGWQQVRVQEFRRPDYEIRVTADPGPYIVGDIIDVSLNADYYGGGGLAGASLDWRVTTIPGRYTPPGWNRWHFGRAPHWSWRAVPGGSAQLSGVTDASGAHGLLIDLLSVDPPFVTAVRAEAQVADLTRQIGSAGVDLLVHPADVSAGLRLGRGWLHRGQEAELDVIVVDREGTPEAGRAVDVSVGRLRDGWWMRGQEPETEDLAVVCALVSGAQPVPCSFTADRPGTYRISADVHDGSGRVSRSELLLWVAGAPGAPDPRQQPGSFELIADRDAYQPGDTARVLVQPPFQPAEALVTIRSGGIVRTERVRMDSAAHELTLPITEADIPQVQVRVEVVDVERGVDFAFGETAMTVSAQARGLDVRVAADRPVAAPGSEVTIDVEVRDADGRAAADAEVALWMVDEAVLGLAGYSLRDPLDAFYRPAYRPIDHQQIRRWVVQWPVSAGPGTLSGLVLSGAGGRAEAGAVVRLVGTDAETHTGYDGRFTLRDITPGEYVLEITSPRGMTGRRTVTVPTEGVHLGNLVLSARGLSAARDVAMEEQARSGAAPALAPPPPAPADGGVWLQAAAFRAASQTEPPITGLREDFAPLALFEPSLRTGADGRVRVTTQLPQSLTRYRIMAVAVSGPQHFGSGEATVTARSELMVRFAAPRFLNYGDMFELPVLVQNVTTRTMNVEVAARSAGLDITGPAGRLLTLAPGARAEVRFDAAAPLPGTAHIQVAAVETTADAGRGTAREPAADATALSVPVYTPATLEAFATYGSVDSDAPVVLPLARPQNVIEGFGGLEVGITATALHSLTDAVLYLHTYPFEGSEHIASRVLAVAALRDVLAAFGAEGLPDAAALAASTERDISDIVSRQNGDGGWPFWRGGQESHPFVTIHVAHALQRARDRGFAVPTPALDRAVHYLRDIEGRTALWPFAARQSAAAYALYVRHGIGDSSAIEGARLMASRAPDRVGGELPIEAAGWLLHVLADDAPSRVQADSLVGALLNRLVETAGTVTFAERYEDGEHLLLHSRRRTDAVLLEALIAVNADADIVTRLAQSLLAHRIAGRWSGTQENAWVLLALDRYFRTYEATTPDFDSRVWIAERYAGGHAFRGRTTDRQHIEIPMPELLRSAPEELVIAREGAGRMYYRAGVRYAAADPRTPALDRGFDVSRSYEAVDDPADVRRDDDGTWRVRAGARVRISVTMVAPSVRFHAALIDPLPAGFEPLNPELRGTGFTDDPRTVAGFPGGRPPAGPPPAGRLPTGRLPGIWRATWFEHQNLRNDRAEAFASQLGAGAHEYSYLARATTPGTFFVPPSRAEMMYQPETFGRGAGDVVIVEER